MHRNHWASAVSLVLVALFACIAGCGPPASEGTAKPRKTDNSTSNDGQYAASDLKVKIGDYMPPLEGGRLEIAPPEDWDWDRPGGDYIVGFVPRGSELNSLPRILVSAEDSPYPEVRRVSRDNLQEFVTTVSDSIADKKFAKPVRPLILGENAFACYGTFVRKNNAVVSQQVLETVVAGRRYAVRLEVYERQFDKYRDAAYAVAMSMKFETGGDSPGLATDEPAGDEPAEVDPIAEITE